MSSKGLHRIRELPQGPEWVEGGTEIASLRPIRRLMYESARAQNHVCTEFLHTGAHIDDYSCIVLFP